MTAGERPPSYWNCGIDARAPPGLPCRALRGAIPAQPGLLVRRPMGMNRRDGRRTSGVDEPKAMRNGQNKRMRGRNRKGQNPLTRVYESNGPDVKIRGTASHVADKYVQLARDAQASGDPVGAENYFQHAEHYYRLIAAAQEQFRQANPYYRPEQEPRDDFGDDMEEDGTEQPAA